MSGKFAVNQESVVNEFISPYSTFSSLVEMRLTLQKGGPVQRDTNEVQNPCNSLVSLCARGYRAGSGSIAKMQGVYTEETSQ